MKEKLRNEVGWRTLEKEENEGNTNTCRVILY